MISRSLTETRHAELLAQTPQISEPELVGYFEAGRIFTNWIVERPARNASSVYKRIAFDPLGLEGMCRDELEVVRVHFAAEAGCWRWQVRTDLGNRAGYHETDSDPHAFPLETLCIASGHLAGAMAHQRFFMGSISEEASGVPPVLPIDVPSRRAFLLPWMRYFPTTDRAKAKHTAETYYRYLARYPGSTRSWEHPHFTASRLGSRRCIELTTRLGASAPACVFYEWTKKRQGWAWYVDLPGASLGGVCSSKEKGFAVVQACIEKLDLEPYVDPTVKQLMERERPDQ